MKRRGHRPDDIIADEAGKYENRQDRDEVHPLPSSLARTLAGEKGPVEWSSAGLVETMRQASYTLTISTHGKGLTDITENVLTAIGQGSISNGLVTLFCRHTS